MGQAVPLTHQSKMVLKIYSSCVKFSIVGCYTQLSIATADSDHFSIKLTNLLPKTTYYYRGSALCILSFGYGDWFNSKMKSFTTLP